MDYLEPLIKHYKDYPAMALLRALEIGQFKEAYKSYLAPVLDLGCGDGYMAKMAFNEPVCAGIDINFDALRKARESESCRIALAANACRLPFKDGTFGIVYSNSAMEHMDGLGQVISEITRVLKKRGELVTLVPSKALLEPVGRISRFLGVRIWNRFNRLQHHVNLLDAKQWENSLAEHGLKLTAISPYCDKRIAGYICDFDLCGKFHLDWHAPFIHLRHCGNIGRLMTGVFSSILKKKFSDYPDSGKECYYFMLTAVKE